MNHYLLTTLKTVFYLIIVWFIGYFVFGENVSIEFSNYQFAKFFPKVLTFAAGASIYFLFLISIKPSDKFSLSNILKFTFGIIIAIIPFLLFKYYSSVGNCQNWEVSKKIVKTHFISTSSASETIKSVETYCLEMDKKDIKTYRIVSFTPIFNTITPIDTTKINSKNWKKVN